MCSSVARIENQDNKVCTHCGQLISVQINHKDQNTQGAEKLFCCSGCKVAHQILEGCKLIDFYALRNEQVGKYLPANFSQPAPDFQAFDSQAVAQIHCSPCADGLSEVTFLLEGVHCAACIWLLEKLWKILPAVHESRLNYVTKRLFLRFNPAEVKLSQIVECLWNLGYVAHLHDGKIDGNLASMRKRTELLRLAVAAVCAANTMLISVSLYQGYFTGMEPQYRHFFHWLSMLLSYPAVFYAALPFYQSAIAGLMVRAVHMDLPIAVGILSSFLYSSYATFQFQSEVYFDSVTMLVFLLLLGRFFQNRALEHAERRAEQARRILPERVRLIEDGQARMINQDQIRKHMHLQVMPGETLPCDGILLSEFASLDTSILTGESKPVTIRAGQEVFAGSMNLESPLEIEVLLSGSETRIADLESLLQQSLDNKSGALYLSDKLASVFLGTVLILSLFSFFFWLDLGVQESLSRMIALLVVTCPCALALAVPLALSSAISNALAKGLLIKNLESLAKIANCKMIFFDKTGTLTQGALKVVEFQILSPHFSTEEIFTAVRFAEHSMSGHPLAKALLEYCQTTESATSCAFRDRELVTSRGIKFLDSESKLWKLGSERWLHAEIQNCSAALKFLGKHHLRGNLQTFLAAGEELVACFALEDFPREDAHRLITWFRQQEAKLALLSGDARAIASHLGQQLGLSTENIFGELSPEQKVANIKQVPDMSVMVGDGANDTAALAAADVGIAFNSPVNLSLKHADVVVTQDSLALIRDLFQGARDTLSLIRSNVILSLIYNVLGISGAFLGVINPLIAALLMPLSSLMVIGRTLYFAPFRKEVSWE